MQYKEYLLRGIKATFMQSVDGEVDRESIKKAIKELFMADLTDLRNKNWNDYNIEAIHGNASSPEGISDFFFTYEWYKVEQTIKDCLTFTNDDVKLLDKFHHDNAEILKMEEEYLELFNKGESLKENLQQHFEQDKSLFLNINLIPELFDRITKKHKKDHKNLISLSRIPTDYTEYYNSEWQYLNLTLYVHKSVALQDLYDTIGKLIDKSSKIMKLKLYIFEEEGKLGEQYNEALTKIIHECHQEITKEFQIKIFEKVQAIKQAAKHRAKESQEIIESGMQQKAVENKQMLESNIKDLLESSMKIMQEICNTKIPSIFDSTIKDDIISLVLNSDENHTEGLQDDYRNKIKNALKLELGGDDHANGIFLDGFMKSDSMQQALKNFFIETVLPETLKTLDTALADSTNKIDTLTNARKVYDKFWSFMSKVFRIDSLKTDRDISIEKEINKFSEIVEKKEKFNDKWRNVIKSKQKAQEQESNSDLQL